MNKLILLLALLATSINLQADDTTSSPNVKIRLQLEVSNSEVEPLGLQLAKLKSDMTDKLVQSNVEISDDPNNPVLTLRIKSIEAGAIATFIQLAFFEQAQLLRNHNDLLALTWSQASLMTISKDVYAPEVTKAVMGMLSSFIEEFQRVFPSSTQIPTEPISSPIPLQVPKSSPVPVPVPANPPAPKK